MSKYQKIYMELKEKMSKGEIKSNSYLPSENELMKQYDVSRDTIRKALSLLLQNGYIIKEKGKGSRVLDLDRIAFPISGITSFKELKETMHGTVETIVNAIEKIPVDEHMKKELYMEDGDVFRIQRIRSLDGEKVILDTDYINAQVIPGITKEIAQDSLYEYIENVLGLKVSFGKKEITVVSPSSKERELLDLKEYDLVVSIKSYTYLEDAKLFQYTVSKHRPDKFRFVDFARRAQL